MHNSIPGGEINTIQTGLKNLDQVIRLGPSFAGGAPRRITFLGSPTPSVLSMSPLILQPVYVLVLSELVFDNSKVSSVNIFQDTLTVCFGFVH